MSKLATLLRRVGRTEPAPFGFAMAAARAKSPGMIVAVRLDDLSPDAAAKATKAGAGVLLFDGDPQVDAETIRAITGGSEVPCGLHLTKPAVDSPSTARALGIDYVEIDDTNAPAAMLLDDEMGFVLAVEDGASDTLLRTLESTSLDALYAGEVGSPFTIGRQLELRRISGLARKPLLLHSNDVLSSEDLECLRDSGVAAIVVDSSRNLEKQLTALRKNVDAMRPSSRRRGDRQDASPTLPGVSHRMDDEGDEEE